MSQEDITSRFRSEFLARAISIISGSFLIIFLARILDSETYGILFLTISILGVLKLFGSLGIAESGARYISEYKEKAPSQVFHIFRISLILNVIFICLIVIITITFNDYISIVSGEEDISPLLLLGSLFLVSGILMRYVRIIAQGLEKIEISAYVMIINEITRLIFALGLVLFGYGAAGALIGYIIGFTIVAVWGLIILNRIIVNEFGKTQRIQPNLSKKIAKYSIPLTFTKAANTIDTHIDTILVGFLINPVAVSYYIISKQIVTSIKMPAASIGFTLSPTYNARKAKGEIGEASRLYEDALSYSLLIYIPAAAGLYLVSDPAIEFIFGTEYLGAVPVLQVLSLYVVLISVTLVTSEALDYLGRARIRAILKIATSSLNVLMSIILIPIYGVVGAALATVLTFSIYTFGTLYIMSKELKFRRQYLLDRILSILSITVIMVIPLISIIEYANDVFTLFAIIVGAVLIWVILSYIFGFIDKNNLYNILP